MAEQVTNYKCPACTGPLHYEGTPGKMECEYCGSTFTVQEIEAMYKDADAAAAAAGSQKDEWQTAQEYMNADGMKAYQCPSCGAELVCEETTAATSCPYCGNPTIVPAQFDGMLKPEYMIPFKLNKDNAVGALKMHYKGKPLLPKAFIDQNHIEEIKGVYVPFWMYDGTAEGSASFEGEKTHKFRDGDYEVERTEHYDVERAGSMAFEKIPADGSSKMPDDLMDSIEPYDYKDITEFSHAYMTGYFADKYDVTAEENADRAVGRAKGSLVKALRNDVTGYDSVNMRSSNVGVKQGKVSYAMMPVWLLSTKWNDKNFLFAMNGQTGKMVGDLPIDKMKLALYSLLSFVLSAVVMFFVTTMMDDMDGVTMFMLCGLVPLIITVIVAFVLRNMMKSVYKADTADAYVTAEGVTITRRRDHYTHTTETRTLIQKDDKK